MKATNKPESKINVGVVGARGYSGQELCRLLYQHPFVNLSSIFYSEGKAFSLWGQFPAIERVARSFGKIQPVGFELDFFFQTPVTNLDVVFLATPNEVSLDLAARFLSKGVSVIDLSGVYRLNKVAPEFRTKLYSQYYKIEHTEPVLLQNAVYGLHPFNQTSLSTETIKNPFLVANPGCYVTSVLMGLIPLLTEGILDEKSIIIDAKSGASGAGKKLNENLLFSELSGDFYPYKVLNHQHLPEIEMYLNFFSHKKTKVIFTPNLLPIFRGLLSTCYLKWSSDVKELSIEEKKNRVKTSFEKHYRSYPLVEWGELRTMEKKISTKAVSGSAMTYVAFDLDAENLIVFSALDNLLKGAASQAIENLNCIYKFPLYESIL